MHLDVLVNMCLPMMLTGTISVRFELCACVQLPEVLLAHGFQPTKPKHPTSAISFNVMRRLYEVRLAPWVMVLSLFDETHYAY